MQQAATYALVTLGAHGSSARVRCVWCSREDGRMGVSVAAIGRLARLATQGDADFNLPKFNAGTQQLNIRVRLAEKDRQSLDAIGDLLVPGRQGFGA